MRNTQSIKVSEQTMQDIEEIKCLLDYKALEKREYKNHTYGEIVKMGIDKLVKDLGFKRYITGDLERDIRLSNNMAVKVGVKVYG